MTTADHGYVTEQPAVIETRPARMPLHAAPTDQDLSPNIFSSMTTLYRGGEECNAGELLLDVLHFYGSMNQFQPQTMGVRLRRGESYIFCSFYLLPDTRGS